MANNFCRLSSDKLKRKKDIIKLKTKWRCTMSRRGRHHNNDSGSGCLAAIFIAIVAMPLIGLHMVLKGDEDQRALGIILTIIGVILWIYLGGQIQ